MNREIKFRAWSTYEQQMLTMHDMRDFKFGEIEKLESLDYKLMQHTGLKDENGVAIYEGDLFGLTNLNDEFELIGEAIFDTDLAQFTIKYTNGGWAELWQHLNEKTNKAREVIGNIYENPELLKQEQN